RGPPRHAPRHHRRGAVRVRHGPATAPARKQHRETRSPRSGRRDARGNRIQKRPGARELTVPPSDRPTDRLAGGLIPAVPVPFRGDAIDFAAPRVSATWMARQPIAGVAVWAHTGRGPYLPDDQRRV